MHESELNGFLPAFLCACDLIDGNSLWLFGPKSAATPDLTGTQITPYLSLEKSLPNPNDCYIL